MKISPLVLVQEDQLQVKVWDRSGEWFSFGFRVRRTTKGRLKVDPVYVVPSAWARTPTEAVSMLLGLVREARQMLVEGDR